MRLIERLSPEKASYLLRGSKLPKPGKKKIQLRIGKITFFVLCDESGHFYSAKKGKCS